MGLTAAVLGPALAAGAAGGTLVDVASLPSAQAITLSAAAILQAFERFLDARELVTEADVGELLEDEYGDVDEDVRLEVVDREVLFDRQYRGKARARLDRDLPSILAIADEATRREELRKLLDRERRFAEQREEAVAVRSMGSIEARVVEAASPEGAYWALSDNVERHTPDCLAMGGKVWPWTVLRNFHPPLHTGCACELRPVAAAVRMLGRAPDMPSPELAFAAMAVQEARWDPADVMWVDVDEDGRVLEAGQKRWGKGTTHGGQFRPRRGGNPGRPTGARMRVRKRRGDLLDLPDAEERPARGEAPPRIAKKKGRELQVGDEVLAGGQWHRVDGIDPKVPGSVVLDTIGRALLDPETDFDVKAAHGHDAGGDTEADAARAAGIDAKMLEDLHSYAAAGYEAREAREKVRALPKSAGRDALLERLDDYPGIEDSLRHYAPPVHHQGVRGGSLMYGSQGDTRDAHDRALDAFYDAGMDKTHLHTMNNDAAIRRVVGDRALGNEIATGAPTASEAAQRVLEHLDELAKDLRGPDREKHLREIREGLAKLGHESPATDPHAEIRAAIEKRRQQLQENPAAHAERIRKFATNEAHAGDTPKELRGEWQELANEAAAAMKAQRGGLEAPYHRGGMYGLPRLPEPADDDRFELRFGKDASLVMWDRQADKPYAVWEKDWNLDAVLEAMHEQNDAARGRQHDPPPAGIQLGELEKTLLNKTIGSLPGEPGDLMAGFAYLGPSEKVSYKRELRDGVLHLPGGFFRQGRARREPIVFRHLGTRLYSAMDDDDVRGWQDVGSPDVPGVYASLNSSLLRGKIKALEPEKAAFVGRLARKHGLPLTPDAEAWLSERGVELEAGVHAGATGVEQVDPPEVVDARALAAELNTDTSMRLTFHLGAARDRGYGGVASNTTESVYRNVDAGITLRIPQDAGQPVTVEHDSQPVPRELVDRLEGKGTEALTGLTEEGWTWTRAGGGRTGADTWHRLVHPDGRGLEVYEAGNGVLAGGPVSLTPVAFGAPRMFTPHPEQIADAKQTLLRLRPQESIQAGDRLRDPSVNRDLQAQLTGSMWKDTAFGLRGEQVRIAQPGGVPTQFEVSNRLEAGADGFSRFEKDGRVLVVHWKRRDDGQGADVVKAGYGNPNTGAHPAAIVSRADHDAELEGVARRKREAEEAQQRAAGEGADGIKAWLTSIEGRKLKRGEQPPKAVMDALLRPGGTPRKTNDTVVMLRDAGWAVTSRTVQRRKGTVFYRLRGKDGSTLEVRGGITYQDANVTSVKVIPNPQHAVGRGRLEPGKVWKDADELYRDALGRADELAERYGAVSDVTSVYDGPTGKALAHHEWNGTIVMSTNNRFRARFDDYLAKRRDGNVTDRDHVDFYDLLSTLQHEVGHGVHTGRPLKPSEYRQGWDIAMEESLNEEAARILTLEWLRAQGMTDTLQAVKRMSKTDYRYVGSYTAYRGKLARVFDAAGVDPDYETRRDLIFRMKFQMSTRERNSYLDEQIIARDESGDHRRRAQNMEIGVEQTRRSVEEELARIARDRPESLEQAREAGEERIARQAYSPTKVMMGGSTRNFGGRGPTGFQPIIDDPMHDIELPDRPGELAQVGDNVVLIHRGERHTGVLTVKRTEPRIGGGENRRVVVEAPGTRFEVNEDEIVEIVGGDRGGSKLETKDRMDVMQVEGGRPVSVGSTVEVRVTGDDGEPEWVEGRVVDLMKSSGGGVKVEVDGMALWRAPDRVR